MTPKRAESYDVRFNWLKCREAQNKFDIIWRKVTLDRADYQSKCHRVKNYIENRGEYVIDMPLSRK